MNASGRAIGTPLQQGSGLTLHDGIDMFWRRKWLLVIPAMIGLLVAYGVCRFIPPVYHSSTLILVEPQKVPVAYVNPTVLGTVDDRLRTISQQIMSRTNLSKIIKDYNLYKPENGAPAKRDGLVGKIQHRVQKALEKFGLSMEVVVTSPNQDEVPEGIVNFMRKDIDVKVIGKEAFAVAYKGRDPSTVMRVTNTLALLFIEENLKIRERQAEGASEFLESQLVEAERALQKQEHDLREFQQQHRGALPAQLDTNLRTLDRLQQELNSINDSVQKAELTQAEERKNVLEQRAQLQEFMNMTNPQPMASAAVQQPQAPPQASHTKLEALKQELARLRATFNENYPDIVSIKKQIEELSQIAGQQPEVRLQVGDKCGARSAYDVGLSPCDDASCHTNPGTGALRRGKASACWPSPGRDWGDNMARPCCTASDTRKSSRTGPKTGRIRRCDST